MGQGRWVVGRWREQAAGALQGPTWADRERCRQDRPGTYTLPERGKRHLQERQDTSRSPRGLAELPPARAVGPGDT